MSQKVLVIGGRGFIGSHICRTLSEHDFSVTIAQRSSPGIPSPSVPVIQLMLNTISIDDLTEVLSGYAYVIFCGGADDRAIPTGDVNEFFFTENVAPCLKLTESASLAGVKKLVILGSYFTHFDREVPAWKLKERHPYIRSRGLQQTETVNAAHSGLEVTTFEIPYVFGATAGKIPLWKPLIRYIDLMPMVFYPRGGTNIMSVQQVAQAVLGLLRTEEYRPHWLIGSENVSWTALIHMIAAALGKRRLVVSLPKWMMQSVAWVIKGGLAIRGKRVGLDLPHFMAVQTANTFLDITDSMEGLGYQKTDMQQAINETVAACKKPESL